MATFDDRMQEKLETLAGSRAGSRRDAAVRVRDLMPLLQMGALKATAAAGSTPTKGEYDALLADVKATRARLQEIADVLQKAVL